MHFTALLALALGNLALAQNSTSAVPPPSNSADPPPTGTSSGGGGAADTGSPKTNPFPRQVGDFQFYGCVSSSAGFPTFTKTGFSEDMSLDLCAASCPSSRLFGVFDTDCFCGEEIDASNSKRVSNDQCSTPCPGKAEQSCGGKVGGNANSKRVTRRQDIPASILLSLYIRVSDADGPPEQPATSTVTNIVTGTITACPPQITDCPIGQPTVSTMTSTICPAEPTPDHTKVIICYGDWCASPNPCHDDHCTKHRVVCHDGENCHPEEVHDDDHGDHWNKVICQGDECHYPVCHGDECHKKIVCYGDKCLNEKCHGDECDANLVCHGDECAHEPCHGDECHQKVICEGDDCHPVPPCEGEECQTVPPCEGPECPAPAPIPAPHPTGGIVPPPAPPGPPVAGAGHLVPAFGIGAIAGLVFFL